MRSRRYDQLHQRCLWNGESAAKIAIFHTSLRELWLRNVAKGCFETPKNFIICLLSVLLQNHHFRCNFRVTREIYAKWAKSALERSFKPWHLEALNLYFWFKVRRRLFVIIQPARDWFSSGFFLLLFLIKPATSQNYSKLDIHKFEKELKYNFTPLLKEQKNPF